jgi:transglutaminase-like putative cysteine protease
MVSLAAERPRVRISSHRGYWRITVSLMLLLVASSFAMFGLISGALWWLDMIGIGVAVLVASAVLRMLGVARLLASVLSVGVLLLILSALFGAGTTVLGLIPTQATFQRFAGLLFQSRLSISEQATPSPPLPEFLFLIALGAGLFAIAVDLLAIAARMPALAALPVVVILLVPAMLLSGGVTPLALVACGLAYLLLLRSDVRTRHPAGDQVVVSLSIAAAATIAALLLATTAPGFTQLGRQGLGPGGVSIGGSVNPLIDLGQDLRRPAAVTVLQYSTTADSPPYLRLTSLDLSTGTIWRHSTSTQNVMFAGPGSLGAAPGLSNAVKTTKVTTRVTIQNMDSNWLPVPYPTSTISGLDGTWNWDPIDLTVSAVNAGTNGQSYTARSVLPDPSRKQLQDAGTQYPTDVQKELVVPSGAPSIIATTARKVAASAASPYDKALALQNYFRNTDFTYSTETPARGDYDNDSMDAIAAFLKAKAGYCVHFATAMTIMARDLGIPARVAMGYLPGSPGARNSDGDTTYTVTSDDLHAWPELYFPGVGWVPFEPTVSRGTVPGYALPISQASSTSTSASTPVPTQTQSTPLPTDRTAGSAGSTPTDSGIGAASVLGAVGIVIVILALLAVPGLIRLGRRASRLRRLRGGRGAPGIAWSEVVDTARDLGMSITLAETPRGIAARLAQELDDETSDSDARVALALILEATERQRFGPPDGEASEGSPDVDWAPRLQSILDSLFAASPAAARLRARIAPASLGPMTHGPAPRSLESRP